jgi:putative Mn2+ efflux pump MntP
MSAPGASQALLTGEYVAINLAVGLGIAADAIVATIGRFHRFRDNRAILVWAGAIGLTHWLLPLIGFVGGWYLAVEGGLAAIVYGAGAVIMIGFIGHVVHEARTVETASAQESGFLSAQSFQFWATVWSVSIDALVSGPGKTAATASWSKAQVWMSFPLVGAVVFLFVLSAAWPASLLRRRYVLAVGQGSADVTPATRELDVAKLQRFYTGSIWVELAIFCYFASRAVAECAGALGRHTPGWAAIVAALGAWSALRAVFGREVAAAQAVGARRTVSLGGPLE